MASDWEDTFSFWAQPPSKTEEQRSENAIRGVLTAVNGSSKLNQRKHQGIRTGLIPQSRQRSPGQ